MCLPGGSKPKAPKPLPPPKPLPLAPTESAPTPGSKRRNDEAKRNITRQGTQRLRIGLNVPGGSGQNVNLPGA